MKKTIIAAIFAAVLATASASALAAAVSPLPTTPGVSADGLVILEQQSGTSSATAGSTATAGTVKGVSLMDKAIPFVTDFYKGSIKFIGGIFTAN